MGLVSNCGFSVWGFDHTGVVWTRVYNFEELEGKQALFWFAYRMCQKTLSELGMIPDIVPVLKYPLPQLPTDQGHISSAPEDQQSNVRVTRSATHTARNKEAAKRAIERAKEMRALGASEEPMYINFPKGVKGIQWQVTFVEERESKTYRLLEAVHYSKSINGRATICWRAQLLVDGKPDSVDVAIKRSFQDMARTSEEQLIGKHTLDCLDPDGKNVGKYVARILHSKDFGYTANFIDKACIDPYSSELTVSNNNDMYYVSKRKIYRKMVARFKGFNRVCRMQVISPFGYPLTYARSHQEAIQAIRDSMVGHMHALKEHRVLHRDISINNILIAKGKRQSSFGFLMDFDFAKNLESTDSAVANDRSGTVPYMSIHVLENSLWHNNRDDAESFLRVLLHVCALDLPLTTDSDQHLEAYKEHDEPDAIKECWNTPFLKLAHLHRLEMTKNAFKSTVKKLKIPQCQEIRTMFMSLRSTNFPNGANIRNFYDDSIPDSDCNYNELIKALDTYLKFIKKTKSSK